jgi:hypothetical protein
MINSNNSHHKPLWDKGFVGGACRMIVNKVVGQAAGQLNLKLMTSAI